MKKSMLIIGMVVALLLTAFPLLGQTNEVTPQTAEQAARTFWNLHHDKDVTKLNAPMQRLDTHWDAFYVFAPVDSKGFVIVAADDRVRPVRALTGCVATAMAQVMKYWNYPVRGTGSHTYNSVSINGLGYTFGEQTANDGYTFTNWTEDDEVVSEEMSYTFVVTQNRDLVANFQSTESIGEQSVHSVVLYPNPTSGLITIEGVHEGDRIELYDVTVASSRFPRVLMSTYRLVPQGFTISATLLPTVWQYSV